MYSAASEHWEECAIEWLAETQLPGPSPALMGPDKYCVDNHRSLAAETTVVKGFVSAPSATLL